MFLILAISVSCSAIAQSYKIMTYNIKYDNPNGDENKWALRKDFLSNQIAPHGLGNLVSRKASTMFSILTKAFTMHGTLTYYSRAHTYTHARIHRCIFVA